MNAGASVSMEHEKKKIKKRKDTLRMQNNLPSETAVASEAVARNPVFLKLCFTLVSLNILMTPIKSNIYSY